MKKISAICIWRAAKRCCVTHAEIIRDIWRLSLIHIFPQPMYFGMKFEVSSIVTMVLLFVINSVQAIGDFSATTGGGLDREPTDKELSGGIMAYGITNIFGSFFGGLPTATFSQNVGIVATTKVVNRMVLGLAAVIILLAGFVPKFSALLTTIPQCVLCLLYTSMWKHLQKQGRI